MLHDIARTVEHAAKSSIRGVSFGLRNKKLTV